VVEVRDAFASDSASRRFSAFDVGPLWRVANVSHSGRVLDVPSRGPASGFREIGHRGIHRGALIRCSRGSPAADERAAAGQLDPFTVPCAMLNTPDAPGTTQGRFPGQRTVTMNC
jgi:hypothetical protein